VAEAALVFVVPGSLGQRTGGTRYDRRIIAELRKTGRPVRVVELPGSFPFCDRVATRAARTALVECPDGATVVIDGLALPALGPAIRAHRARLWPVALIHHPLARESGLSPADRQHLFETERDLLRQVARVIVTSPATARMLDEYDVGADRIETVIPGTDPAPVAARRESRTVRLLCVASLIARKGHATLIAALAGCAALDWRLDCLGALDRDRAVTAQARALIRRQGLAERIGLHGEADDGALAKAYAAADVFVLASELEGYGMAFAEALAHGLPIVGSGAGAVRETVPAPAGLIVPVGDRAALSGALARVIANAALRATLAEGARAAARRLPDWPRAARNFAAALVRP
jgi:glycosyltransferase involved in cell wall biosynthesis